MLSFFEDRSGYRLGEWSEWKPLAFIPQSQYEFCRFTEIWLLSNQTGKTLLDSHSFTTRTGFTN